MKSCYEVVIIGGGVAGASLAYRLTEMGVRDIAIIEREARPGSHASGRSAQVFLTYSPDDLERRVVVAARSFFAEPPPGFARLLDPTGVLLVFGAPDWPEAQHTAAALREVGHPVDTLEPAALAGRMPVPISAEAQASAAGALWLPDDGRLDVSALMQGYLAYARERGAELFVSTEVTELHPLEGRTRVHTTAGACTARWVVNAAGAWAGRVGALAGAVPIAFRPCRRTVINIDTPVGVDAARWPLLSFETYKLYIAPEAGGLLASPMDEERIAPCDAAPMAAMIAETRARLARLFPSLADAPARGSRAGLRTFAPDDQLVIGPDPRIPSFFWLAGQGGWGIESSPVIGRIAAELLLEGACASWPGFGPDVAALSPMRFG